jgi:hypothetical protein
MSNWVEAPAGSRYQDQRRYVVAVSLDDLRGPTAGAIRLERSLDWSGDPGYDLDDDADLAVMYQTVLNQATTPRDLNRWLDAVTLRRLRPNLWLPAVLRAAWEARFPELKRPPKALAG